MVAPIPPGDTTQWDVLEWAFAQAEHLTPSQHHLLLYLAAHAFYQLDNPEGATTGQVLRQASYVASIRAGTGLGTETIRRVLTSLQMAGYIQRGVRQDPGLYGQQPHLIYVLWECDELRQGLRDGARRLPSELLSVPSKPARKPPERAHLSLVKDPSWWWV